jgi:hypothetical protein
LSAGPSEPSRASYRWVFDPLDGTTNYAHGLPSIVRRWPSSTTARPSSERSSIPHGRSSLPRNGAAART